jgi:hypothetical protein
MKTEAVRSKDPDLQGAIVALRRASRRALELGLRTGTPVWVIKDGRIVDLTKEKGRKPRGRRTRRNAAAEHG